MARTLKPSKLILKKKGEKPHKHAGRPKAQIDWKLVENLAKKYFNVKQICNYLKISEPTMNRAVHAKYGANIVPRDLIDAWATDTDSRLMEIALTKINGGEDDKNGLLRDFLKWRFNNTQKVEHSGSINTGTELQNKLTELFKEKGEDGIKQLFEKLGI